MPSKPSEDVKSRIAKFEVELRSSPRDIEKWIILADLYAIEEEDLAKAIESLHQGIDACTSPGDKAVLHSHASDLLMANNRLQEAKNEIEAALSLQPYDAAYWDQLILVDCRLGLYEELLENISKWEKKEPERYAVRRCRRAVQRFKTFSRARPKAGFSYKEEVYGLYGAAALGTSEDNGIDIWKYYFYTFDEYAVAHVLFRFANLVHGLGIPLSSVVPAEDGFSLPIALAMAEMLCLPIKRVGENFCGERPILVKAWGYETQSLMQDRARVECSHPARVYSFVLSGTKIFRHEIPPDFCAVETAAPLKWEEDVDCPEDSWIGRMDWAKAEEHAKRIVNALDRVAEYEPNIEQQVEWYVKKHPYLACLDKLT